MESVIRMSVAKIIGRSHLVAGSNCQDAMRAGRLEVNGQPIYYGVICDGCSEGSDSEVGAKLAAVYLGRQMEILIKSRVPTQRIPAILRKRLLWFLRKLLGQISFDSPESRIDYIKNNLLFTVIGFVCAEETVIFAQGDGVVIADDVVSVRDEQDTPMYLGYELVDRRFLSASASPLPTEFDCVTLKTEELQRMAIASDALAHELDVIPELWENDRPIALQRKVNAWSFNAHKFKDDLSLIVLEKTVL